MRILLAEDEVVLCDQIKKVLMAEGRIVDVAHDGQEACFLGSTEPYDMIILDLGCGSGRDFGPAGMAGPRHCDTGPDPDGAGWLVRPGRRA